MKQPLILTLLIMVSICTSMAQQMDRPDMKHTSPIQQERSDSSIEQPCLIDRDLPAQQTAALIVTESLGMGLSATLDSPVQSNFFENMRSDATVNTPLAIGNKPPKETESSNIEQPEPQKKRSKIRISLFKNPKGKNRPDVYSGETDVGPVSAFITVAWLPIWGISRFRPVLNE
jgi:hypothetical protein